MSILETESYLSRDLQKRIHKLFGDNDAIPEIKHTGCSMVKTQILLRLVAMAEKVKEDASND